MDNIDLRKKSGASRAFPLGTALVSAAFALGAASLTLLLRSDSSGVMSISTYDVTNLWLCFALLVLAQALCIIMPCACVLTAVLAVYQVPTLCLSRTVIPNLRFFHLSFLLCAGSFLLFRRQTCMPPTVLLRFHLS